MPLWGEHGHYHCRRVTTHRVARLRLLLLMYLRLLLAAQLVGSRRPRLQRRQLPMRHHRGHGHWQEQLRCDGHWCSHGHNPRRHHCQHPSAVATDSCPIACRSVLQACDRNPNQNPRPASALPTMQQEQQQQQEGMRMRTMAVPVQGQRADHGRSVLQRP